MKTTTGGFLDGMRTPNKGHLVGNNLIVITLAAMQFAQPSEKNNYFWRSPPPRDGT